MWVSGGVCGAVVVVVGVVLGVGGVWGWAEEGVGFAGGVNGVVWAVGGRLGDGVPDSRVASGLATWCVVMGGIGGGLGVGWVWSRALADARGDVQRAGAVVESGGGDVPFPVVSLLPALSGPARKRSGNPAKGAWGRVAAVRRTRHPVFGPKGAFAVPAEELEPTRGLVRIRVTSLLHPSREEKAEELVLGECVIDTTLVENSLRAQQHVFPLTGTHEVGSRRWDFDDTQSETTEEEEETEAEFLGLHETRLAGQVPHVTLSLAASPDTVWIRVVSAGNLPSPDGDDVFARVLAEEQNRVSMSTLGMALFACLVLGAWALAVAGLYVVSSQSFVYALGSGTRTQVGVLSSNPGVGVLWADTLLGVFCAGVWMVLLVGVVGCVFRTPFAFRRVTLLPRSGGEEDGESGESGEGGEGGDDSVSARLKDEEEENTVYRIRWPQSLSSGGGSGGSESDWTSPLPGYVPRTHTSYASSYGASTFDELQESWYDGEGYDLFEETSTSGSLSSLGSSSSSSLGGSWRGLELRPVGGTWCLMTIIGMGVVLVARGVSWWAEDGWWRAGGSVVAGAGHLGVLYGVLVWGLWSSLSYWMVWRIAAASSLVLGLGLVAGAFCVGIGRESLSDTIQFATLGLWDVYVLSPDERDVVRVGMLIITSATRVGIWGLLFAGSSLSSIII